jgi:transcriptional regulator with XRE-family HTH domain
MKTLGQAIRRQRLELGFTQAEVARRSGVSLATLQNIEAGRANPAFSTLSKVLDELALTPCCQAVEPDWDALCGLGLPMSAAQASRKMPGSGDRLIRELAPALAALSRDAVAGTSREAEAIQALLLALRLHFPDFFAARFSRSSLAWKLTTREPDGRVIKLYRIARAALAEYL